MAVVSNWPVDRIGIGSGFASFGAACTSARPNSAAVNRSGASGRPARSRTDAKAPRSADTGSNLSTRPASVATVESAAKGTEPVTASIITNASA